LEDFVLRCDQWVCASKISSGSAPRATSVGLRNSAGVDQIVTDAKPNRECHRRIAVQQPRTGDPLCPSLSQSRPSPKAFPSLLERFNSGKVEAMMALYAPEAVFIAKDGRTITDRAEIAAQFQRDMSLGLPLKANVRHVFVGGDTAQIVVDWSIDGKGPDGEDVHLGGSASDIVRRGADGFWRYIIDNNQGTAVRQPA
jgi:ketosteroid isomerase-like protein